MKARRSMVTHRNTFKYTSPAVTTKRFSSRLCVEDQENIAPEGNSLKRRKLYNGQAEVDPKSVYVESSKSSSCQEEVPMDMDTSSSVITPKRINGIDSPCFVFTPPNRIISHPNGSRAGSFSTPRPTSTNSFKPKTIQEVMRNVVVYVEVITIEEDRSDKIKSVVAAMGAQVNNKLYKNTTHVIFREGSMTTYKKALKMNIPLVSVSWLEECRKTLSVADPALFPPINLDPYERPDLYRRVRKEVPSNGGEVATTPERFALKYTRPDDELDKMLLEYQQIKSRLGLDSPTSSTSNFGRTMLNFSPIGESTKLSNTVAPKTPSQSNVTPLLRRLMIRNAEEDRRERGNLVTGRTNEKPLPVLNETRFDRVSMDLSSMWGKDLKEDEQCTINGTTSMVEDTVDLTDTSPDITATAGTKAPTGNSSAAIMKALRRQTLLFTSNAAMDISPAAKENVAIVNKPETEGGGNLSMGNASVDAIDATLDGTIKVPKICGVQRKSLEEDTLREDIVRAKEELLGKSVMINNKSDKRRSLMPIAMGEEAKTTTATAINKVNRRRTLFNVAAISEGGLTAEDPLKPTVKQATKRRTLLPTTSSSQSSVEEEPKKWKRTEGVTKTNSVTSRKSLAPVPSSRKSLAPPPPVAAIKPSQTQRKGTNMGPPEIIPPISSKAKVASIANKSAVTAIANKPTTNKNPITPTKKDSSSAPDAARKRKLFNSVAELSPISSPVQSPAATRLKMFSKPVQKILEKPSLPAVSQPQISVLENPPKRPAKSSRRSTLDFQSPVVRNWSVNSSTASSSSSSTTTSTVRGSSAMSIGGGGGRPQRNVIVLTNGQGTHLDFIKELVRKLGGNFEVDTRVTSKTTHLVCYEKKRNMNMLRGVIRGVWLLDYEWILKSDEKGQWQREEEFLLVDTFGNTLTKVRSERLAFGANYKMDLFSGTGNYFVYEMTSVPVHHVKELIMLCGGIVVDKATEAKYLIGDKARTDAQVAVISTSWVFDCVCQYAFLNHKKYLKK